MKKLFLLFGLSLLLGCIRTSVIQLEGVEITDYQGERLGSINDFRENSIKGPQYIDINAYRLEITGLVDNASNLTYGEVLSHQAYSKVVTVNCVEGWSVKILWEGVLLKDLFEEAGVLPGADTVIFYAYDGYSTSHPLDYLLDNDILIAYKMNGLILPPEQGYPFQLVAEAKWGYKWIKWITRIDLSNNSDYEGYWESRGYSSSGSLNESFLG